MLDPMTCSQQQGIESSQLQYCDCSGIVHCLLSTVSTLSIDCCCVLLMFIVWRAGSLKSVVYQPNVLCCYTLTSDLEKIQNKQNQFNLFEKTQTPILQTFFRDYSNRLLVSTMRKERSFRSTFSYSFEYKEKIGGTPGVHYNLLFPISCNGGWSVSVRVPIVYSVTLTLRSQMYIVGAGSATRHTCSE